MDINTKRCRSSVLRCRYGHITDLSHLPRTARLATCFLRCALVSTHQTCLSSRTRSGLRPPLHGSRLRRLQPRPPGHTCSGGCASSADSGPSLAGLPAATAAGRAGPRGDVRCLHRSGGYGHETYARAASPA